MEREIVLLLWYAAIVVYQYTLALHVALSDSQTPNEGLLERLNLSLGEGRSVLLETESQYVTCAN